MLSFLDAQSYLDVCYITVFVINSNVFHAICVFYMYVSIVLSLSTVVLNSRDR